jgi:hypothetical protein
MSLLDASEELDFAAGIAASLASSNAARGVPPLRRVQPEKDAGPLVYPDPALPPWEGVGGAPLWDRVNLKWVFPAT